MAKRFAFIRSIFFEIRFRILYRYPGRIRLGFDKLRRHRVKLVCLIISAGLFVLVGVYFDQEVLPPTDSQVDPPVDLWGRIRSGIILAESERGEVNFEIRWFLANKNLNRVGDRAGSYMHLIVEAIEARGLPMDLALVPIIESSYRVKARSRYGAAGLWQLTGPTSKRFRLKRNWWYDGRYDILASTSAALDYFEHLNSIFKGDWLLSLAAYNCGASCVVRAIHHNRRSGMPTDFWSLKLPRETLHYVPRLLAVASVVAAPEKYRIKIKAIANEARLTEVDTGGQIDLKHAAKLAGTSLSKLKRHNPGFKRLVTAPGGPHTLLVPIGKARGFISGLAAVPAAQRGVWRHYKIKKGDTLAIIADRYKTSVIELQRANNLRGTMIRVGHRLIIRIDPTG